MHIVRFFLTCSLAVLFMQSGIYAGGSGEKKPYPYKQTFLYEPASQDEIEKLYLGEMTPKSFSGIRLDAKKVMEETYVAALFTAMTACGIMETVDNSTCLPCVAAMEQGNNKIYGIFSDPGLDSTSVIGETDNGKTLVIAFRHARTHGNWFDGIKFYWTTETFGHISVRMHQGMYNSFKKHYDVLFGSEGDQKEGKDAKKPLRGVDFAKYDHILLTGHSMGAVVAQILSLHLHYEMKVDAAKIRLLTFGAPDAFRGAESFFSNFGTAFSISECGDEFFDKLRFIYDNPTPTIVYVKGTPYLYVKNTEDVSKVPSGLRKMFTSAEIVVADCREGDNGSQRHRAIYSMYEFVRRCNKPDMYVEGLGFWDKVVLQKKSMIGGTDYTTTMSNFQKRVPEDKRKNLQRN